MTVACQVRNPTVKTALYHRPLLTGLLGNVQGVGFLRQVPTIDRITSSISSGHASFQATNKW